MADGAKRRAESLENKHVHEHQLTDAEQKVMESFETLDYDVCENALYRERNRNYSEAEERTRVSARSSAGARALAQTHARTTHPL